MSKTAIVTGGSGLIGTALLERLCAADAYSKVKAFVRKPLAFTHPKLEQIIVDFDNIRSFEEDIAGDDFFSCLGTTKSKTPNQKEYYKIDHDYPVQMAEIAARNGMQHFHIISSIGANARSKIFYTRMKGETERDVAAIPFRSVHIYRPSFLSGNRKEQRALEKIGLMIFELIKPLLRGPFRKYRAINAGVIAEAILVNAAENKQGLFIYESDEIQKIGTSQKA